MSYLEAWFRAFVLTLVVECALVVVLPIGVESRFRRLAACVYVNLASHPLLWLVFPSIEWGEGRAVLIAELWAVACEVAGYRLLLPKLQMSRVVALATALNLASFAAGRGLRALGVAV